jgi:hypothetical protein
LLEERREERKEKMPVKISRNSSKPLMKSKKAPTSAVKSKEAVQAQIEYEVF